MKHLLLTIIVAVVLVSTAFAQEKPDIPIWDAVKAANLEAVEQHLAAGFDVNTKDNSSWSLLHRATSSGHLDIANLLISKGADINAQLKFGASPLHIAINMGDQNMVLLLVNEGSDLNLIGHVFTHAQPKTTPLILAILSDRSEIAKLLIENGVNITLGVSGLSPLHAAAKSGSMEIALQLIELGANINAQDSNKFTPLHFAANGGHVEVVQLLIEHEADINLLNRNGCKPLYNAIEVGSIEVVELLLGRGADVNEDEGTFKGSPLNWAARVGQMKMVELLISKGADPLHKTVNGATILHSAVQHKEIVGLLLGYGVDLNVVDNDGRTAMDTLCRAGGGPHKEQPSMETFEYLSNYLAITIQADKQILLKAISVVPKVYEITRQVKVYDQHGFPMGITFETESIEIPSRNFTIEVSDDLMIWEKIGETTNDPDDAGFIDKREKNSFKLFYRVVLSED